MRLSSQAVRATVLTLFLSAATLGVAHAQGGGFDPQQMRERALARVEETVKTLALDETRAGKVREILVAATNKRFELMGQGGPPSAGAREAMAAIAQDTEKQLAEVLTPDEMEKYRKMEAERRPRGGRPGGPPGGPPGS